VYRSIKLSAFSIRTSTPQAFRYESAVACHLSLAAFSAAKRPKNAAQAVSLGTLHLPRTNHHRKVRNGTAKSAKKINRRVKE
jgi:hypothetical protein